MAPLYVASDGRRFATQHEVQAHERSLRGLADYLARRTTLPPLEIAAHLLDDFTIARRPA